MYTRLFLAQKAINSNEILIFLVIALENPSNYYSFHSPKKRLASTLQSLALIDCIHQ